MDNKATPIIVIVILIILAVLAYVLFFTGPDTADVDLNIDQATTTQDNVLEPITWQTYTNEQFDFTFTYPSEAETTVEAGRAKVTLLGPDNTPNSEITDGLTFYVDTEQVDADASLQAIAQERFESETENLNALSDPRSITIGNQSAYEFEVESELGPGVTHVIQEGDEDTIIHVMYTVLDPANRQYDQIIQTMLLSLQYTGTDDDQATSTPAA